MLAGVAYGPDFHLGTTGRYSDHYLEVGGEKGFLLVIDLLDESLDHHLRRVKVGDNAVAQGPDGLDAGIGMLMHQLGLLADSDAFLGIIVYSDNARLVKHLLVVSENDRVGSAEVHCYFLR